MVYVNNEYVRKIDELGRIVIPKEIRNVLSIHSNDNLEIFIDNIPVSRDRRIFRAIYFNGKTQQQVANELHIDRSLISKTISKYI